MNYYKRHVGDYTKDASHLSLMEHGAYTLILDRYYATERPISRSDALRVTHARSEDEVAAVDFVLTEFFVLHGDVYRSKRADEELNEYQAKADLNRENGKLGGRPSKKPKENPDGNPEETQTVSETKPRLEPKRNPEETLAISHKPLAIKKAKASLVPTDETVETILAAYHEILPRCKRIAVLTDKRLKRVSEAEAMARKVCTQQGWDYDPAQFWAGYFEQCSLEPWLRGDTPNPKNPAWKQHLLCLIAEERFADIMDAAIAEIQGEEKMRPSIGDVANLTEATP